MEPILRLHHISKTFSEGADRMVVLQNIDLEIFSGEIMVVVGPSGSGKSTLLRIMSGLERSYQGGVTLGGGLSPQDFSFVFQQFALLPWLTVAENIGLGLVARGVSLRDQKERVAFEIKQFGLEHFSARHPRELSGGMRQRVGIARALATDPKLIFMDEPFSELDSFTADALRKELLAIWHGRRAQAKAHPAQQPTIVLVTHIVEEAIELADRIAVLTPRPGKIEKIVINSLSRPRQKRSAEFYSMEDALYKLIKP